MEKLIMLTMGIMCCVLLSVSPVRATIVNPNNALFYNNSHSQLFMPADGVLSIEIGDTFGLPGENGGIGSMFGFFFANNPVNQVVIFDAFDQGATALIDFHSGIIYDSTAGHGTRTFGGFGPIGFFLTLDPLGLEPNLPEGLDPNLPTMNLYSIPGANPGGYEAFSSFPAKDNPNLFLLAFDLPGSPPLALELVGNLTPLPAPVPEPATAMLLGAGLMIAAVLRGKLHRN